MNLVAAAMFPFSSFFPGQWSMVWLVFWGCGLVDLFVGSLGISPVSDLRRASESLGTNPWVLRIVGMVILLTSLCVFLCLKA